MAVGDNCTISIPRFGKAVLRATYVSHGINLFTYGSSNDTKSRTGHQFFTSITTSGSFELGLVFSTFKAHENFMQWCQRYVRWMGNPNTESSPARVLIPSRKFDKTGVLERGIEFGDKAGRFYYTATLTFKGGRDTITIGDENKVSEVTDPTTDRTLVRLYPSGNPLSGANSWNPNGQTGENHYDGGGTLIHAR